MSSGLISEIVLKILLDLAIILIATKLLGLLAKKLGLPQVVGMVVAGLLVGPAIIGLFTKGFGLVSPLSKDVITLSNGKTTSIEFTILQAFSQIGVLMILFAGGLKTNIKRIKGNVFCSTVLAFMGVFIPLILGFLFSVLYMGGFSKVFADRDLFINCMFIGTIMTATSVAITVETLTEMGKLSTNIGTTLVSAAIIDDVIGIVVLSIVLSLKNGGAVWYTIISVLLFFGIAIGLGLFIRWVFKKLIKDKKPGITVVILALAMCFVYAFCAERFFGVAPISGAYVAGLMLSGIKEYSNHIEKQVSSIGHIVFIPVFFAFIGISADFSNFKWSMLLFSLIFVIIAIVAKVIAGFVCGKCFKKTNRESLQLGAGMTPRGEVALAVYGSGAIMIASNGVDPILGVVLLIITSSIVCPLLLKWFFKTKAKPVAIPKQEESVGAGSDTAVGTNGESGEPSNVQKVENNENKNNPLQ